MLGLWGYALLDLANTDVKPLKEKVRTCNLAVAVMLAAVGVQQCGDVCAGTMALGTMAPAGHAKW